MDCVGEVPDTYHVVPGSVIAADFVKVNIVATNGVIHVIDHVLLPPGE